MPSLTPEPTPDDLRRLHDDCERLRTELSKAVIGQSDVVTQMIVALLAGGHCLLTGVPGLAKTLLVRSLAAALQASFQRIQFTPDLMPADILGAEILQIAPDGERSLRFIAGPIFANIVLADEINRTPPKTQAALLEAMQEQQVTVGGVRHALPRPFFVLATRNPIEQEGAYPLPEAQLDRFLLEIHVPYPSEEEEFTMLRRDPEPAAIEPTMHVEALKRHQELVRRLPMTETDLRYALRLVRGTRRKDQGGEGVLSEFLEWGAGPRATDWLVLAARAHAALQGRLLATADDVRTMAPAVLRHRLLLNFSAHAQGRRPEDLIQELLNRTPAPGRPGSQIAEKFLTRRPQPS